MGLCHAGWVGSLTAKPWTYGGSVLLCVMAENAVGGALDPPPFNTFNGLWLDELKHFIVRTVIWGRVFLGVLL